MQQYIIWSYVGLGVFGLKAAFWTTKQLAEVANCLAPNVRCYAYRKEMDPKMKIGLVLEAYI